MKQLPLLLVFLALSFFGYSQCLIVPSAKEGCIPSPVTFKITNSTGKTITKYDWDFGDGSNSTQPNPTHVYNKRGIFSPQLIMTLDDGSKCTAKSGNTIQIFDKPVPIVSTPKKAKLCFDYPLVKMEEKSKPGADGAPIVGYLWDFGDGTLNKNKSTWHQFPNDGLYSIVLEILDDNGCKDTTIHKLDVSVYNQLNFDLRRNGLNNCPTTKVNFLNKTDSNGWDIKKVKWFFGDSSWQEATKGDANWSDTWNGPSHTYTKDGQFSVWLVVENINGCKDSVEQFNIENVVFEFDPSVSPESPVCFDQAKGGNAFVFRQPFISDAQIFWDFGDPSNLGTGWSMGHLFETPGYYSVNLKIKKGGCIRDTTLCGVVHIQGPVAKIQRNASYRNDSVPDYNEMPPSFPHPVEICKGKPLEYYTLDTLSQKVSKITYCNADTISKRAYAQSLKCKGYVPKFNYKLKPSTTAVAVENVVSRKKHFYHPDTPVVRPVFSAKTGTHIEGNMHDTSLYAPHCSAPHTVNFLNNSIKFRRYDAVDNFPGGFQDICINPTYPYASDSLNYFWNFGDKHAKACTSSTASPDAFCAYSSERLPKHTYTVDGCYKAFMTARDPETNCENRDSIIITLEPPNAAWDSVAITQVDKMDYNAQKRVGLGRRGIIIDGPKCVGYIQEIIIDELLPECGPDYFWIMPDSAAQTKLEICGGDTLVKHNWMSADDIKGVDYRYAYADTGWKSVGVVVKSGGCFDTFWYNKYKYMYHVKPEIIADKDYICPGDSFTVKLLDTTQEGITHLYFTYAYKHDYIDADSIIKIDTVDFISRTDTAGKVTNITSTIHNYSTGLMDSFFYNNLSQTSAGTGPKPGHVIVSAHLSHRLTCSGVYDLDISMGHQAEFKTKYTTYCLGDSIEFEDSVRYFASFESSQYTGIKDIDYWADPLEGRQKLPQFPEQIQWDFDGDGIIDHIGAHPKHAYTKPGIYSVHMYTMDSFNCGWQILKKKDFIKVVSLDADFGVINDDTSRFCAPQFFEFEERSTILQPNSPQRDTIVRWKWKWGDGAKITLQNLPNGIVGRSYRHNGDYRVFMRAELATFDSTGGKGCVDTQSHVVHIEGPRPKFKLVGDSVGCTPFTARVMDLTKRASVWEWTLGNGNTKPSYGADSVDLHYDQPGIYCIGLAAGDTIRDLFDSTFYCIDDYPYSPCKFSVEVQPIDPIALDYDSLICVDQAGNFNLGRSDTLYTRFIIDFGDGVKESRDDSLYQHAYAEMGKYKIEFTGESPCPDTGTALVNVLGIKADFEIDQTKLDTPTFGFINTSTYGNDYEWFFGENTNYRDKSKELSYVYNSPGKKEVCLVAYNILGCPDTMCKDLEIVTDLFIPNVFTPQGDRKNPTFEIAIKGETKYELVIFNRWGEKVFESDDKKYQWNGKRFNNGALCNTGTYYFVFNYQILGEEAKKVGGTVTLLR